jgi:nitrate/nitrite transporter NarK
VALWSIVGLLAAVAAWQLVPNPPPVPGSGRSRLALDWRILALASIGGSCFAVMAGFFTMMPTIAVTGWGFSPAGAASFTGWMRATGLGGSLLGGWVADRIGRVPGLAAWFLIGLGCAIGLALLDFGVVFGALIAVMTNAACAGATAYYALLGDAYRPGERERTFSLIAATASVIGSVATPVLLGLVLSASTARAAVAMMIAGPVIGLGGLGAYVRLASRR